MQRATRNQLQNVSNPYQGKDKKVLCLCSAGLLRSPTTAAILRETKGYNTRAAGIEESYALIPVTEGLLAWADSIVVMDAWQETQVLRFFDECDMQPKTIHVLNVPDNYAYMNETLVGLIKDKVGELDV